MVYGKGILESFIKFTFKHLYRSLLLNKKDHQACNFIKKRLQHMCFPVNIGKFLRTRILKNICERLLLQIFDRILCHLLTHSMLLFLPFFKVCMYKFVCLYFRFEMYSLLKMLIQCEFIILKSN